MKVTTLEIPVLRSSIPVEVDVPVDATVLAVSVKSTGFGNRAMLVDVLGSEQTAPRKFVVLKTGDEAPESVRYVGFATEADKRDQPRLYLFELAA